MIKIEHNTLYLQSINNIRLMQHFRDVKQEKRDTTFAELLGKEMRSENNVVNNKGYAN